MNINTTQLEALASAGAVRDIWIAGSSAGWGVNVNGGWLLTQRGQQRTFAKVETALALLRSYGIAAARITWDQWSPEQGSIR